jgi:hypothetical protein
LVCTSPATAAPLAVFTWPQRQRHRGHAAALTTNQIETMKKQTEDELPSIMLEIPLEALYEIALGKPGIDHTGREWPFEGSDETRQALGVIAAGILSQSDPATGLLCKQTLAHRWPGMFKEAAKFSRLEKLLSRRAFIGRRYP